MQQATEQAELVEAQAARAADREAQGDLGDEPAAKRHKTCFGIEKAKMANAWTMLNTKRTEMRKDIVDQSKELCDKLVNMAEGKAEIKQEAYTSCRNLFD